MPFAFLKAAASCLNCASIPWLPPPLHAPAHSHFPERPLQPGPTTARSPMAPRATSSNEHLFTPFLPVSLHCRPAKARTGHGHRQQLAGHRLPSHYPDCQTVRLLPTCVLISVRKEGQQERRWADVGQNKRSSPKLRTIWKEAALVRTQQPLSSTPLRT